MPQLHLRFGRQKQVTLVIILSGPQDFLPLITFFASFWGSFVQVAQILVMAPTLPVIPLEYPQSLLNRQVHPTTAIIRPISHAFLWQPTLPDSKMTTSEQCLC